MPHGHESFNYQSSAIIFQDFASGCKQYRWKGLNKNLYTVGEESLNALFYKRAHEITHVQIVDVEFLSFEKIAFKVFKPVHFIVCNANRVWSRNLLKSKSISKSRNEALQILAHFRKEMHPLRLPMQMQVLLMTKPEIESFSCFRMLSKCDRICEKGSHVLGEIFTREPNFRKNWKIGDFEFSTGNTPWKLFEQATYSFDLIFSP